MTEQPLRFKKKPVTIEAVQLSACEPGEPLVFTNIPEWLEDGFNSGVLERRSGDKVNGGDWDFVAIQTLEGEMLAGPDWWIIRGLEGELYPCKNSVFRESYEVSDD